MNNCTDILYQNYVSLTVSLAQKYLADKDISSFLNGLESIIKAIKACGII